MAAIPNQREEQIDMYMNSIISTDSRVKIRYDSSKRNDH